MSILTNLDRVQRFDLKTQTWRRLEKTGYIPHRHSAVCTVGNNIYVIGGNISSALTNLNEIQVFDATKLK